MLKSIGAVSITIIQEAPGASTWSIQQCHFQLDAGLTFDQCVHGSHGRGHESDTCMHQQKILLSRYSTPQQTQLDPMLKKTKIVTYPDIGISDFLRSILFGLSERWTDIIFL